MSKQTELIERQKGLLATPSDIDAKAYNKE
jgi:hypothetical protein